MGTRTSIIVVALAAVATFAAGCGSDKTKCPTESPAIQTVGACSAVAGATVSFPIRLCPTCNQILSDCDVDLSQIGTNQIFLNPVVEVCEPASSCGGAACNVNPSSCSFTAPAAAVNTTYTVLAFDPQSGQTRQGSLTIVAGAPSCTL